MIIINKTQAPAKLSDGISHTESDCSAYEQNPNGYESGANKFEFKDNIYNHKTVKEALRSDQHGKCCYCESKFAGTSHGDVEHYRPKAFSRQSSGKPKVYPGYYWLVYVWDNLYFSCEICNRSGKQNYFPLRNPGQRARNHSDNLAKEDPLILNPGGLEDPRSHIRFHEEIAQGITEAGRATIEFVDLNRGGLCEDRRKRLDELKILRDIYRLGIGCDDDEKRKYGECSKEQLCEACHPKSEFSAMASDFLSQANI